MSVTTAAAQGDRRGALSAVAQLLAEAIESADDPRELEGLSRELRLVLKELESLPVGAKSVNLEDALAARRKAKQAANG